MREQEPPASPRRLLVCLSLFCRARGSKLVYEALRETAPARGLAVEKYFCFNGCGNGPNVVCLPEGVWYADVRPETAAALPERIARGDPPRGSEASVPPTVQRQTLARLREECGD